MQTKTVGVVIPIYNVEKYLKECLDSVINQTYTNLEIILVNDGSTDEDSLNIAKEYTLKDKRITLFDKKNGGLSSARNVGIEYFSGEYKLKNKAQAIKENSLIEFNIEGNNPYEIYTVYKSHKAFNNEQDLTSFTYPIIDYIIFLDSDDYWELNCIEECVPRMDGVDVVWFEEKCFYDNVNPNNRKTCMDLFHFNKELKISMEDWFGYCKRYEITSMWTSVLDMINFNFLKNIKLKFIDAYIHEDNLFRIILYIESNNIHVAPNLKKYNHRIRPNSIMNYNNNFDENSLSPYLRNIYYSFDKNMELVKKYHALSSWCHMAFILLERSQHNINKKYYYDYFLKYFFRRSKEILTFNQDPLSILVKFYDIQKYLNRAKTVGVVIPIYNVEKYLKECLDSVINQTYTNLEIILVNDGSTDEDSLNIAKEYTLKDKRITLFDKKNGGQSTARNIGIEYFSGEYKLKNKAQAIKENSLIEFNIEGNNPYEIYTVYKSHKAFNNEQDLTSFTYPIIDYIIFLDSDDYWELNCIEECVPRMDGVDVVWFDYANIYEKNYLGDKNDWSWFYSYNRSGKEGVITSKEWFNKYEKIEHFAFVWSGMIDFMYLRKIQLKFIDRIFHQDIHFGILLFIQSSFIFLLPRRNLNYRIRNGATTIRKFKDECLDIPMYIEELLMYFNGDIVMTKHYYSLYSWIQIFIKFISISNIPQPMIRRIIFNLSKKISKFELDCKNDPLCIKDTKQVVCMLYDLCGLSNDENIFNNVFRNSIFQAKHGTAKSRIQNQLSYKLGQTMIINSKSFLGCLIMPAVLLSIIISHKQEQKIYQEKIKNDPSSKLPPLEYYPDYKEALKFKNHLSYKLGQALIKANKTWYKGGYVLFFQQVIKNIKR